MELNPSVMSDLPWRIQRENIALSRDVTLSTSMENCLSLCIETIKTVGRGF